MSEKDEAFLKKLLSTFRVEAGEHIGAISSALYELEKSYDDPKRRNELIERIFREVHSMKGAARAVNLAGVESLCRSMEDLFSALKRGEAELVPGGFDFLYRSLDALSAASQSVASDAAGLQTIVRDLESVAGPPGHRPGPNVSGTKEDGEGKLLRKMSAAAPGMTSETTRVSKAKLDSALLKTETLIQTNQALSRWSAELKEIVSSVREAEKNLTRGDAHVLSDFLGRLAGSELRAMSSRLAGMLDSEREFLKTLREKLLLLQQHVEANRRSAGLRIDDLLSDMKQISMMPFSALFEILPRTARDLLKAQGKEADLSLSGAEVEADRRILQEMRDPLIHLLRNCIDHGIEKKEERTAKGKPPAGKISIAASYREDQKVEVVVTDDGAGIDVAKAKASALKHGLLSPEEAEKLDQTSSLALIFRSGVSTSPAVTDLSGRGLGLAIVQEKVERLGGVVACESSSGAGTVFRVVLPLSLASLRGLLVRVGQRSFVIPAANVRRTVRVRPGDIKRVSNRETIPCDGATLPLIHLGSILNVPTRNEHGDARGYTSAAVLESEGSVVAFRVDEILHEQEILVKGLGRQLKRVRNISGVTVLASGELVPVLNVWDLMRSAATASEPVPVAAFSESVTESRKTILVVEDSITARTLLKNILEAAGYEVRTAMDGTDAYTLLKSETVALVVSDVDMPRMNGFDLTSRIRSDPRLSGLPVILVTAMESRESRERGIDVGANAYVVKSSFDQSNLLELIRRLV